VLNGVALHLGRFFKVRNFSPLPVIKNCLGRVEHVWFAALPQFSRLNSHLRDEVLGVSPHVHTVAVGHVLGEHSVENRLDVTFRVR